VKQRFKIFVAAAEEYIGASAKQLEEELNKWAESLSASARIRRTQLAMTPETDENCTALAVLVNYEIDD
jgi:hypothetical protein